MSNFQNVYKIEEQKFPQDLTFIFISKGKQDIIKAIQYSLVGKLDNVNGTDLSYKTVYNFGFGDYDITADVINDNINSNNGDAYKIFNTVLSTVPIFFETHSTDVLIVQGSDGRPEFVETCKETCTKNCVADCRNFNRRIAVYRGYINKNHRKLIADYQFFGGVINAENELLIELYEPGKNYDAVLLLKKKV